MTHSLPKLPYEMNALTPHLSAETLEYHWGKHHRGYVDALNHLISGTPLAELRLEDLVRRTSGTVFNNAAQHFNHSLYWRSMSPEGGGQARGRLREAIERRYGTFGAFRAAFTEQAGSHFGSGWAWLTRGPDGSVRIELTRDADCPMASGGVALLVCDLWEHAYYIDYRNMRRHYLESFWSLADWRQAETRYESVPASSERAASGPSPAP